MYSGANILLNLEDPLEDYVAKEDPETLPSPRTSGTLRNMSLESLPDSVVVLLYKPKLMKEMALWSVIRWQ